MKPSIAAESLREHVFSIPIIDTHEHIPDEGVACANRLGFFGLFEHYVSSDLVSAGMPRENLEALRNPDNGLTPQQRWALMADWWPYVRTTGYGRAMLEYLHQLFGVEDVNPDTVLELCRRIDEAHKPGWFRTVLKDRANIDKALVIRWPGQSVEVDRELFRAVPILDHYAMVGTRADLAELEIESGGSIQTLDQLMNAQEERLESFTAKGIVAVKLFLAYRRTLQLDRYSKIEAGRVFDRLWLSQKLDLTLQDLKPLQDIKTRR